MLEELIRQWSAEQGGNGESQNKLAAWVLGTMAIGAKIHREQLKGTTTIRVLHPDGRVKRIFTNNDREIL